MQQIQEETGCRLQFKNETMPQDFKLAMLTGTPQQLQAAEAKIMSIIEQSKERSSGGGRGRHNNSSNWGDRSNSGGSDGMIEMNIEVPANKCGEYFGWQFVGYHTEFVCTT